MKVFTNTFDLAKASPHRFWVAPYSDFKIGIKILAKGEVVDKDFTVKAGAVELTPDEDKIDGFTLYTLKSGDTGFVEYTIEVEDIAEKLKLTQIVTDSTVFEVGGSGGGDVPADVATKTWVNSQISDFITDDALTAYVPLTGNANMTGSLSVSNESNGVYLDSSNGVTVWDVDEGKRKAISLDYDGLFVKDYNDSAAKEIEYPTKSGTMVVDADLTAYYTKSETSSATELAEAFAGAGGGGAISAFDMSENPVMSKTMVENAVKTNTCLPQTIVQYTDNSISVYDIVGNLDMYRFVTNSKKINFGTNLSSISNNWGMDATSLEEIVIPDSVKVLIGRVFSGASKLNSVKGGNSISSFAVSNSYVNTFRGCTALSNFTLNNVLTSVGYAAFDQTSIKRITIPDNITALEGGCFGGGLSISSAIKIEVVDFGNTRTDVPTIRMVGNDWPFGPLTQVYVPDALYDTWIAATNWSSYEANIHRHSELEAPYLYSSKVTGGAETGTTGTPAAVNAVKSVYETDWATLSATADANTFYVVLPDPA